MFSAFLGKRSGGLRGRATGLGVLLVGFNLLAWVWAVVAFGDQPLMMGTALLAYSFGLRHAVDADHIAAIDNVTRKLMQDGRRPVAVGLFFSLGHSAVVFLLTLLLATTTYALQDRFADLKAVGGVIGTSVSAFFLFAIAIANLLILADTWRSFQSVRAGGAAPHGAHSHAAVGGGLFARLFRRLFRLVDRSWHMLGLGFLFGLGFETATEVGLLGLSATGAANGHSAWTIMVFPTLFSAGMALVDTLDGMLMVGAYGWAFVKPLRKLYYNLTMTLLSAMVAIFVGGVETLGLIGDRFQMEGAFWDLVGEANGNFGLLGYGIIVVFMLGWLASLMIYKLKRYDEIEMISQM